MIPSKNYKLSILDQMKIFFKRFGKDKNFFIFSVYQISKIALLNKIIKSPKPIDDEDDEFK